MDAKTLRAKSAQALVSDMEEAQTRLQELRFKLSSNQLKDVREVREIKRTIARIQTIQTQSKKIEANKTQSNV